MRIIPEEKKLYELLSGNLQYEIPMYQRNYDWKAENVTAFLDDLKIAMEQKEEHFFWFNRSDSGRSGFGCCAGHRWTTETHNSPTNVRCNSCTA